MTSQTILRAEQLICGYGRKAVIGPLDLTIARGSLTAIIGPNGAGKSTCFKTLTGVLPPLSGKVSLLDKPLSNYTLRERARLVSMVNQQIIPQPLRVYDYVLMGRLPYFKRFQIGYSEEDHARCDHYLERTGTARLADKRLDELSGGEQQMVAIAQALTQEPQLLLLDEPISHLDIGYTTEIMQLLETLHAEGLTILMILHDINVASEYCEELILFGPDGLLAHGTPQTVLTEAHLQAAYHTTVLVQPAPASGRPYIYPQRR